MTGWSIDKLIRTAQAHDRRARRFRDNEPEEHVYFDYSSSRKLAFVDSLRRVNSEPLSPFESGKFDARKFARRKVNND